MVVTQMNAKQLREERAKLVERMNELSVNASKEDRAFNNDELSQYDAMDKDAADMLARAETLERVEKAKSLLVPESKEVKVNKTYGYTAEDDSNAFRAWALRASGNEHLVKDQWKNALDRSNYRNGNTLEVNLLKRAQTKGTTTEGGYTVNGTLVNGIEKTLAYFGGMREVSQVIRTETGATIAWATNNDTSNMGALVDENTQINNTGVTFGQVTVGAYKFTSLVQPVSLELLQDGAIDVGAYIAEVLGERLARAQNYYFTIGTGVTSGSSEPQGVVTGASEGVVAASASAITYAELVDLYHSVDVSYRKNATWMLDDTTLAYVKKIVDGDQRPLWGAGLNAGQADTIMGKPVIVNNDIPVIASSAKVIVFGDFKKYLIRDVMGLTVRVLNERYIDTGSIGFLALSRNDGVTLNSAALKYLQMHA